jgi:hypothetical protein
MAFFDVRRVRVRPEYAPLYPEIVPGVWMSARRATRLVKHAGPQARSTEQGCAGGRVLCDAHFEFRGGRSGRQYLTGEWTQRSIPAKAS